MDADDGPCGVCECCPCNMHGCPVCVHAKPDTGFYGLWSPMRHGSRRHRSSPSTGDRWKYEKRALARRERREGRRVLREESAPA